MDTFKPSSAGSLIIARASAGIIVTALAYHSFIFLSAIGLILCVWIDVLFSKIALYKCWHKNQSDAQLESFADFICFILAPCIFTVAHDDTLIIWLCITLFSIAGMWRIARFNVEGLVSNSYEGLPVTYNGYLFPLLALAIYYAHIPAAIILVPGMLIISSLMITRKIKIPEL